MCCTIRVISSCKSIQTICADSREAHFIYIWHGEVKCDSKLNHHKLHLSMKQPANDDDVTDSYLNQMNSHMSVTRPASDCAGDLIRFYQRVLVASFKLV